MALFLEDDVSLAISNSLKKPGGILLGQYDVLHSTHSMPTQKPVKSDQTLV